MSRADPPAAQGGAMGALARQASQIARSALTVLITGESGTGKTRLARSIHDRGPRAAKPFISLSCAALPRDLLESELFGYERGAFTGAIRQKPGRVELANGGTLFLDEVGEMPPELQPKLLTFLQERSFYRIGGHSLQAVDTRLIAATNRNLAAMVAEGKFREDLFYRLNVLPLEIPPLRERVEEIPVLALEFLNRGLAEFQPGSEIPLSMEAVDFLLSHPWPGNIRELENAMLRAATLAEPGLPIGPDLIAPSIKPRPAPANTPLPPPRLLSEIERQAIAAALVRHSGHKAKAAGELGISLKTIYNKIHRYGL